MSKTRIECNNFIPGDKGERCGATIWAPHVKEDFVEDRAFSLFAMETEGDISTRRGKIQKLIACLAEFDDPDDENAQEMAFNSAGIDFTLTDSEQRYVVSEVRKRWW